MLATCLLTNKVIVDPSPKASNAYLGKPWGRALMLHVGGAASRAAAPWAGLAASTLCCVFCGGHPPAASSTEKPAPLGGPWVPLDTFTSEEQRATCPAPGLTSQGSGALLGTEESPFDKASAFKA